MGPEIAGKLLQLLKEVVPKATRVGVLNLLGNTQANLEGTEAAARALRVEIEVIEARDPESLNRVFETAIKARVDALIVFPGAFGVQHQQRVVELAGKHHVPAIYQFPDCRAAGSVRGDINESRSPDPA